MGKSAVLHAIKLLAIVEVVTAFSLKEQAFLGSLVWIHCAFTNIGHAYQEQSAAEGV